jgi:hypothetical protein
LLMQNDEPSTRTTWSGSTLLLGPLDSHAVIASQRTPPRPPD